MNSVYKPFQFFGCSFLLASLAWLSAAYLSYHGASQQELLILILAGLASPTISALFLFAISGNKIAWTDFWRRLKPNTLNALFVPVVILCMPMMIALAIIVSLVFGLSTDQFSLAQLAPDQALEGANLIGIICVSLLSCSLEEIGWRGYGIESLNQKFNLWKTSLIFALLWGAWHVPAFFIKDGYFQQAIWNMGIGYTAVYFATLIPVTFLINWVYIKNNRSILIAILAHTAMNVSVASFALESFTRVILMVLLFALAGFVVRKDRKLFFYHS